MDGIPAKCRACGHTFTSQFIGAQGSWTGLTFGGGTIPCPKCKSLADFGSGIYDARGGTFSLVNGPQLTRDMIRKLQAVAQSAQEKVDTGEEQLVDRVVAEIAQISPELATILRKKTGVTIALLLAFLTLLLSHCTAQFNVDIDMNELWDQVQGLPRSPAPAEQSRPQQTPEPPPPARPDTVIAVAPLPSKRARRRQRGRVRRN